MSGYNETIIPKGEIPTMPSILQTIYTFSAFGDGGERLTEDALKKLVKNIRKAKRLSVFLCPDSDIETALEEEYMQVEIDSGWIFIQYVVKDGCGDGYCCSCFDPDYLESDEESPMVPGDGQSVILKRYTMHDPKLAADCAEYYARTGRLYPGMEWLKS